VRQPARQEPRPFLTQSRHAGGGPLFSEAGFAPAQASQAKRFRVTQQPLRADPGAAKSFCYPRKAAGSTAPLRAYSFEILARTWIKMSFCASVIEAIGDTPLIKLRRASELTGCTILGKAEFMNPGGSVKDRAALAIVRDAIARGSLKPGGLIVEGTAGNTGIGLALVANAMGYKTVIVIPDTQSEEKKDMLRLQGAELIEVPAVAYSDPNNYVKLSGRLAERLARERPEGAVWANQFDNVANRKGHFDTTGPEIWAQTDGKVDGFICAVGTGGTLAGVGMALKAKNPNVKIAIADPLGAALYAYYTSGELRSWGSSITEGIGQGRITANLEDAPVDLAYQISDEEALPVLFDLAEHEGLLLGGSSAINIAGAIRLAKDLGAGRTIVTILADSGTRYQSKLFNPEFLRSKTLPVPGWMERKRAIKPDFV
jgi:cysteine synthase A